MVRGQGCSLAAVNSWSTDYHLEIFSLIAAHGNCYALLIWQSECAFDNASGRLLVNLRYGSLVPRFPAPGNHGYWEKNDLALLMAQGATATHIVFIDYFRC